MELFNEDGFCIKFRVKGKERRSLGLKEGFESGEV